MINFVNFVLFPTLEDQSIQEINEEILNEADHLINNGSREIILLGQNVNAYNYNEKTFI